MPKLIGWLYRWGSLVAIVGLRILIQRGTAGEGFLIIGWVIGSFLAEADHLFYVAVCNPQELTCQRVRAELDRKNWRNAWGILKSTQEERTRLPIHNVLTGMIIAGLGIWVVTSSGSLLASGVVVGLGIRLFSDFLSDQNFGKWYWLFAKQFSPVENRGLKFAWGALLLIQAIFLLRG